ncbi:hypothetical protein BTO04_00635 [Polaribacter sp. SA4-10]|uniref:hypothetical protein n=1 Tax=Polaribacter sp. SA4-10 TaxID=754397 RepID=UPI000B3D254D|nr:hypothetical protein [Polaribacter sp. SA4-10]ARV05287.1 hypothetical protein BTO04_00635 [Polaribacter sp. SA4-10]
MQPIPIKVKNVTIYQYFNPLEPLTEVILTDGTGTYSLGTLGLNAFYNLTLDNEGKVTNPLNVHVKYYATFETESGHISTTPWMYCLDNSDNPEFGRTIHMVAADTNDIGVNVANESGFITLGALTNITVSQFFPPPAIGQRTLITNGTGNIIATKLGTPHEMGVQVDTGDWFGTILAGSKNIMISGKTKNGDTFSQTGYTVITGGKPAIFLKEFFQ